MNERDSEHYRKLLENAKRIDHLCDDFERAWLAGERPKVEAYLDRVAETGGPQIVGQEVRNRHLIAGKASEIQSGGCWRLPLKLKPMALKPCSTM